LGELASDQAAPDLYERSCQRLLPDVAGNRLSNEVRGAKVGTPVLVIGGRQDLPGFQEEHLRKTLGTWFENSEFTFITDAGHFPVDETPVYHASILERFLDAHRGACHDGQTQRHKDPVLHAV
jgi:pimeloyl-ACP methyl ester carboxylesterase